MPAWVAIEAVLVLQREQIDEHGGLHGLRDWAGLESALARPQQRHHYETPDIAELAAALAFGLVRNHPFIDGNKRASFQASVLFLRLNGYDLPPGRYDKIWHALAAGRMTEAELVGWFRERVRRLG